MEPVLVEAEERGLPDGTQAFIEQYLQDDMFFRRDVHDRLQNDQPPLQSSTDGFMFDDISMSYLGSESHAPPLPSRQTVPTSSRGRAPRASPGVGAASQDPLASPELAQVSPVTRVSEYVEKQTQYNLSQALRQTQGPQIYHAITTIGKRFSQEEKQMLEKVFTDETQKPSTRRKQQLAEELNCGIVKINNWFQNRRAREKQANRVQAHKAIQETDLVVRKTYGVDHPEDESDYAASSELYLGSDNDCGGRGPVTTRQQSRKAVIFFQGEHTKERGGTKTEELSEVSGESKGASRSDTTRLDLIKSADSSHGETVHQPADDAAITNNVHGLEHWATNTSSSSDDMRADEREELSLNPWTSGEQKTRREAGSVRERASRERSNSDLEDLQSAGEDGQADSSVPRLRRRIEPQPKRSISFACAVKPREVLEMDELLEHPWDDVSGKGVKLQLPPIILRKTPDKFACPARPSNVTAASLQDPGGNEIATGGEESLRAGPILEKQSELPQKTSERANAVKDEDETRSRSDQDSYSDEAISVQSYADSMFDDDSVASSASSIHSDTQAFVQEYVDFLIGDPILEQLFMRSMSSTALGFERFRRNYSKILQSYARDLKRQSESWSDEKSKLYAQGLNFIARRSITAKTASLIASRYMEKTPSTQFRTYGALCPEAESGYDTSSGDESSGTDPCHTVMISELRVFFREGAAFQRMRRNLQNLVIPSTVLSRVKSATERILDLLLSDQYLMFLLSKSSSDDQSDPGRELRCFGSRLKTEAGSSELLHVAKFLETYASYIGTRAVQRINTMDMHGLLQQPQSINFNNYIIIIEENMRLRQPRTDTAHQQSLKSSQRRREEDDSSRDTTRMGRYERVFLSRDEGILETIIDEEVPSIYDAGIDTHWPTVASSNAFKEYVDRVRDIAIPTFFSEVKRLISGGFVGFEDPKVEVGETSLLRALEEVQWCFMQTGVAPTITISTSEPSVESFRVSNTVKLAVEASLRSEWQWWPLQPPSPREKTKDADCRMSWQCSCGAKREEIVPFVYASKLSHLASQFPLSNEPPDRPPSSLSSVSSQETKATCGSEPQSTISDSSSVTGNSSLHGSTVATTPSSSVISFGTPPKAFVFLLVKASRYTLAPIDVTEKKARDFFQAIVTTYNQSRGWWRRLLSIFVFSHCDFVEIKRYAPQSFDPGFRFSFPPHDESPHDKEYRYYPRPMPHAPVSRHMFNHLYNACYSDQALTHKLHSSFTSPTCIIKSIPGKLLDGMPKRDRLVDEEAEFSEDQDVEVFWGLVAREQRSALRVVIYMLLGLGPSLWFMFQWLFGWGHNGDLQSASVPLTLSATMLGVLLAVVYSSDDVREMEQPL